MFGFSFAKFSWIKSIVKALSTYGSCVDIKWLNIWINEMQCNLANLGEYGNAPAACLLAGNSAF